MGEATEAARSWHRQPHLLRKAQQQRSPSLAPLAASPTSWRKDCATTKGHHPTFGIVLAINNNYSDKHSDYARLGPTIQW